ncbi:hypothetical protein VB711_07610 [Cronbergia sp. UHCC 0137]|uniref:hypothetical protein n=1 Tax=Cronbergia sp. UHCC 0137 TaxID=3110239 RepID=UPI002B1F3979|nr:hypothetical protein [Cronbergia sp. UHCC 0137]MEA5617702.1 hypothetical protein [Cronbergia sp. UHCC 0137]
MKTAEKLAAGWLLTLGFMFLTLSVSATLEKISTQKAIIIPQDEHDYISPNAISDKYDERAVGGLIYGVPTFLLGGWLALGLYRQSRLEKKALNQQVNENLQYLFYQMLKENHGRITLLSFAMQSQLPALEARYYLDEKAKEFNANFQVNEEGGVSYHFDV